MTPNDLVLKAAETATAAIAACPTLTADLAFNAAYQLMLAEEVDRRQNPQVVGASNLRAFPAKETR